MKILQSTDFVICNTDMTEIFQFADIDQIVIYGNREEAILDLYEDEVVVPCTELPKIFKEKLLKQINQ